MPIEKDRVEGKTAGIENARDLPDEARRAIWIVKAVLDVALGEVINGQEIEAAVTQGVMVNKHSTLRSLVHHGIKYFTGRIKAAGVNVAELQSRARDFLSELVKAPRSEV